MTVQGLIEAYKKNCPDGHFFDDETLEFFGDDLDNATVNLCTINTKDGAKAVWKYTANQRNAPVQPYISVHYFNALTFEEEEINDED